MKNLCIFLLFLSASLLLLLIYQNSYTSLHENNIAFIDDAKNKESIKPIFENNKEVKTVVNTSFNVKKPKQYKTQNNGYSKTELQLHDNHLTENMVALIEEQKLKVIDEMKLLNKSSAMPGVPTRSLIVTTFRSGSTFTTEILGSHPGTFVYYEPLYKLEHLSISQHKQIIKDLFNCHIPAWYIEHMQNFNWTFRHNFRLQEYCRKDESLCLNSTFVEHMCQQFPFISMKVTRFQLRHIEQFLEDSTLNLNIVYLVRDPRGTMTSRHRAFWCMKAPRCGNYSLLCDDLKDDYHAAVKFAKMYPKKFRIIRYEDISVDPFYEVPRLFDFLHLRFSKETITFLEEHTTVTEPVKNPYSTIRNSSATVFLWRTETSYKVIEEIQGKCNFALNAWGYILAKNISHQKTFLPVVYPFQL